MKKHIVWIVLLLAAIACNLPATSPDLTEEAAPTAQEATEAPTTDEAEPTEAPTEEGPAPTDAPPTPTPEPTEIGFSTGNLTDVTLPGLVVPGRGGPLRFCGEEPATGPTITLWNGWPGERYVCLENYPTAGVNRVQLDINGPVGPHFSQFYTSGGTIFDSDNVEVGRVNANDAWDFLIHIPAWLPSGTWTLSASLPDGSLPSSTTFEVEEPYLSFTTADPPPQNPFVTVASTFGDTADYYEADFVFAPGSEVFIYGANYPPNTTLTVALYRAPLSDVNTVPAEGINATRVTTDANGSFQTSYVFPADNPQANYNVVIDPDEFYILDENGLKIRN